MAFEKGQTPWNKNKKKGEFITAKVFHKVCPSCKNKFTTKRENQIHCDKNYYGKSEKLKEYSKNSKLIKGNKTNKYHLGFLKDNVGYSALHDWVRYHKPKTGKCAVCGATKSGTKNNRDFDLANISGEYKRDINDFEWLCCKCHGIFDMLKRKNPYEVIGVESKISGELDKIEKQKCRWLLDNGIFSKILISRKTKIKNKVVVEYEDFVDIEKRMRKLRKP